MIGFIIQALGALIIFGLLYLIGWLIHLIVEQQNQPQKRRRQPPQKPQVNYRDVGRVRELRREVIRLLQGDAAAADRLIESVRRQNPGQGEEWCWEKVIFDIERDRQ